MNAQFTYAAEQSDPADNPRFCRRWVTADRFITFPATSTPGASPVRRWSNVKSYTPLPESRLAWEVAP